MGLALEALHAADPLRLRRVASLLRLPEWLVAYAASLFLTVSMSLVQLVIIAPVARAALAPVNALLEPSDLSPSLLQGIWTKLIRHEAVSAYVASPVFPGFASAVFYFLACLPYALVDLLDVPWIRSSYKHQPTAPQRPDAWAHALFLTGWHHVFYIIPGLYSSYVQQGPWLYFDYASPESQCMEHCDGRALLPATAPPLSGVLLHLVACFLLFDASYHFWHWAHHASPVLYKHVHSIHHEYNAPFCWVTQHEHVLELLVVSIWSVLVPMGLGCHPLTEWLFLFGAIQASVEAHSGYTLGPLALLQRIIPSGLWGGSVHHDNHHRQPRSNFQPFFTYLDRGFGTLFLDPTLTSKSVNDTFVNTRCSTKDSTRRNSKSPQPQQRSRTKPGRNGKRSPTRRSRP